MQYGGLAMRGFGNISALLMYLRLGNAAFRKPSSFDRILFLEQNWFWLKNGGQPFGGCL